MPQQPPNADNSDEPCRVIGPEQPPDVLREAGQKAIQARRRRAAIKADFRSGSRTIHEVLTLSATDEAVGRMRLEDLLKSLPGYGTHRVDAALRDLGIDPGKRLRGLGPHQIARLIDKFSR